MNDAALHPGKFFIISFPENLPCDETLSFIQDNHISGIILFGNHCEDRSSLKSWLRDFKKSLGRKLIVAVDQEGGCVRRFKRNFPGLESPRYYGYHNKFDQYRDDLKRVCEELHETGININLVPTVDLFDTDDEHVLDTRTFSDDPEIVSRYARVTIDIHHEMGLLCCGKHFPGLGRSENDPHLSLSQCNLSEKDFFEFELRPFSDIASHGVDSIMVTHLNIPRVDENPAVVSRVVINEWLKQKLKFENAVITDDLLMLGALEIDTAPNLALRAFEAGVDFLLFGQKLKQTKDVYQDFSEKMVADYFSVQRIEDAALRADNLINQLNR
ncbi:MAG: glycoside hydrolase family 3 N-terminal domain-containing protein [candidate division Zixibacteria bacterium]